MVIPSQPSLLRPPLTIALTALFSTLLSAGLWTSSASANALVDEGRRLYEEAEFVASLDALGRAAAGHDLDLPELISLLELSALVHSALGDEEAARGDLRILAAVAPEHTLNRGIPPDVQRMFTEIRASSSGSPRLVASPTSAGPATGNGVTVSVSVENDWAHAVRAVRIRGRAGDGTYLEAIDAPLFVSAPLGEVVSYYVEALGPGGAVIARAGSDTAPLQYAGAGAGAGGSELDPVPFIIGGAAALVVIGVVIAVAVGVSSGGGQPNTAVEPFVVRF